MSVRINPMRSILASVAVIAISGSVFAADAPKTEHPAVTKEMREKMAALHEQMAACLRSDKSIAECRNEMAKSHHDMMGDVNCPGTKMHPMHGPVDQQAEAPRQK